jgi:hypothetical protein
MLKFIDDRRPTRAINLDIVFDYCRLPAPKKTFARAIGKDQPTVTRLLTGKVLLTDKLLSIAVRTLELDQLGEEFPIDSFEIPPVQFESLLRRLRYGWLQAEPVFDWLEGFDHHACSFVPEQAVRLLLVPYRDSFGRAAPQNLEEADATGQLGRRYGILMHVDAGPVLDAVRQRAAAALIIHQDRATQALDMIVTDPTAGRGSMGVVAATAPQEPDPELAILDGLEAASHSSPCLLAGNDGGYVISGVRGRRDVYVTLFVRSALSASLLEHSGPFGPNETRALRHAVEKALQARQVQAVRFVYDAL